jgi:hypothetical protein
VNNSTNLNIDASGGTAIADASGGDDNLAVSSGNGDGDDDNNRRPGGLRGLIKSRYGLGRLGAGGNIASAGNGGRANASADGGIVVIGEINSGGNRGNTIDVGNIGGGGAYGECGPVGPVSIDGGDVDNSTNIDIDASGGVAIGDASGGSGNLAAVSSNDDGRSGLGAPIRSRYGIGGYPRGGGSGGTTAAAGNGGIADVSADGGIVTIDEINSGGNQGNTIAVGDICAAPVYVPSAPSKPGKPGKTAKPGKIVTIKSPKPGRGGKGGKVRVNRVPDTGVGHVPAAPNSPVMILVAVLPAWHEDED